MNPQPSGGLIHAAVKDLAAEAGGPPAAVNQHGDNCIDVWARYTFPEESQRKHVSCYWMWCWPTFGVNCESGSRAEECGKCRSGSVPGWARSIYQFIFLRVYCASCCSPPITTPLMEKRQIVKEWFEKWLWAIQLCQHLIVSIRLFLSRARCVTIARAPASPFQPTHEKRHIKIHEGIREGRGHTSQTRFNTIQI